MLAIGVTANNSESVIGHEECQKLLAQHKSLIQVSLQLGVMEDKIKSLA
jgi:hypothetical protein